MNYLRNILFFLIIVIVIAQSNGQNSTKITDAQLDKYKYGNNEYRLAIIGDSGAEETSKQVMGLRKFDSILHLGDYDYYCKPDKYFTTILDANRKYDFMGVIGNHDTALACDEPGVPQQYVDNIYNEMKSKKNSGIKCEYSSSKFMWSCVHDNVRMIGLAPGMEGADPREEQLAFLKKQLSSSKEDWKICAWHYYDIYYHTGRYQDSDNMISGSGESFYDVCRKYGAIIFSAHDHVYARTRVMSQFSKPVIDKYDGAENGQVVQIRNGATFNVLNGVGGFSVYIEQGKEMSYSHWQTKYALGLNEENKRKYGGLFCTFNVNGNNRKAFCEFPRLNSDEEVFDSFYIYRNDNPGTVDYKTIDWEFKNKKLIAYKEAYNIVDDKSKSNSLIRDIDKSKGNSTVPSGDSLNGLNSMGIDNANVTGINAEFDNNFDINQNNIGIGNDVNDLSGPPVDNNSYGDPPLKPNSENKQVKSNNKNGYNFISDRSRTRICFVLGGLSACCIGLYVINNRRSKKMHEFNRSLDIDDPKSDPNLYSPFNVDKNYGNTSFINKNLYSPIKNKTDYVDYTGGNGYYNNEDYGSNTGNNNNNNDNNYKVYDNNAVYNTYNINNNYDNTPSENTVSEGEDNHSIIDISFNGNNSSMYDEEENSYDNLNHSYDIHRYNEKNDMRYEFNDPPEKINLNNNNNNNNGTINGYTFTYDNNKVNYNTLNFGNNCNSNSEINLNNKFFNDNLK